MEKEQEPLSLADQWQAETASTEAASTLEQMDDLIQRYAKAREKYDEQKAVATDLYKESEELKKQVINALKANKRTKFETEGVGTVFIVEKEIYTVPKVADDKTRLFNYIKDKYGADTLMSMVGINHQTLNGWANREVESGVMQIPGLEAPTMDESLSFRRKK
jgi:DNA-binding transcriptional regulator YbjK